MSNFKLSKSAVLHLLILLVFVNCDNSKVVDQPSDVTGSGSFIYTEYLPFANKPIDCFYHIPTNSTNNTPILIALPGADRDALSLRNDLINKANKKGFIVLAPRFSDTYFPGGDAYNLANIFEDGDNPDPSEENPQDLWTFSAIDPLFQHFKTRIGNTTPSYDLFGFSAGAQLAHRFLIFAPNSNFNRVVSASAGWYNAIANDISFPYGLKESPQEGADLTDVLAKLTFIIVGEDDTNPNSAGLRHTPEADAQGLNRLQRAQHFFQQSSSIAQSNNQTFNWSYSIVPNADHERGIVANFAADLLY